MPSERGMMSKNVQVSQKVLFALGGLLLVSLAAAGYLSGRQSALPPTEQPTSIPSPREIPLPGQAEQTLDSRVVALEGRIGTLQKLAVEPTPGQASPQILVDESSKDSQELEARRAYFKQLDSILGSSAIQASEPIATRLIEQAMTSDKEDRFESTLAQTAEAAVQVKGLQPPPICVEHKALVMKQLQDSLVLLKEVQLTLESNDATKLDGLSKVDERMLSEAVRLRELDRSLRPL